MGANHNGHDRADGFDASAELHRSLASSQELLFGRWSSRTWRAAQQAEASFAGVRFAVVVPDRWRTWHQVLTRNPFGFTYTPLFISALEDPRLPGVCPGAARSQRGPSRVDSIDESGDRFRVAVTSGDQQRVLEADKVLQAIGFQPRVEGYGLENTGVKLTERGAVEVDAGCRTSVPHIYAIGDVTAKLMLAHAAEAMGVIAAETIADVETAELDYVMIPRATYSQPQIASFG
jgi:hypothetical protein